MVALAALAWPLPGRRPVDMVHIENSAVAVDTSFPVCGKREVGEERSHSLAIYATGENVLCVVPILVCWMQTKHLLNVK